jgi:hypothetical protein
MRSLKEIQEQIVYMKSKQSVSPDELKQLRREEFDSIDQYLMKENEKYWETCIKVIRCIGEDAWEMRSSGWIDATEHNFRIDGFQGWINDSGLLSCKALYNKDLLAGWAPQFCHGTIDHFGRVKVTTTYDNSLTPLGYWATSVGNGEINFTAKIKDNLFFLDSKIFTILVGDVFARNKEFRKFFLAERNKLYAEIEKMRA